MNNQDIIELQRILGTYGVYNTVKTIMEIGAFEAKANYANNSDAIIHTDIKMLEVSVEAMKESHPLRRLQA